jgi:hypothetical protein
MPMSGGLRVTISHYFSDGAKCPSRCFLAVLTAWGGSTLVQRSLPWGGLFPACIIRHVPRARVRGIVQIARLTGLGNLNIP